MSVRNLSKTPRPGLVLSVVVLAAVLIWIDTTILGIALERIADPGQGLGAGPGELQWAVGAYALTFATSLFAAGALGDRYGHRTILLAGLSVFGLASVWAAWAPDPAGLIAARGLMGVGGAMIMPTSMGLIGAVHPPDRRAGAIAIWSASSGLGVTLGPLLGGVLVDHFWWGSVFLVNVPIVVVAGLGVVLLVPNPRGAPRRPDVAGLVLSTTGLAALAYGLIEAGQEVAWGRAQVWLPVLAGLALLVVFTVVEWRSDRPSFDPRLFADRRFAAGTLALATLFFGITGQMFYGNLYLQGARGMTALDTALAFVPSALGVVVGSGLGAGLAARFGVARTSGPALLVVAAGFVTNLTYDLGTSLWWFCSVGAAIGLAMGIVIAPTTAAVLAVLPPDRMGSGSAVNTTVRQVGSVLGIAVLGTVLTVAYRRDVDPALTGLPEQARDLASQSAEQARHLAAGLGRADLAEAANHSFVEAMHVTAVTSGLVAAAGAVMILLAFRATARPATAIAPASVPLGLGVGAGGPRE